ncbi:hypothetical protein RRG08_018840 [Elysia crispata]|uniref:Uncharacterized protein n=1 Tax=Elysia crispata TaxID=231223 RepID=A0AAE0YBG4_9GAST|nr:hypothetical protein RRG08_018840 [Elysia crispata]
MAQSRPTGQVTESDCESDEDDDNTLEAEEDTVVIDHLLSIIEVEASKDSATYGERERQCFVPTYDSQHFFKGCGRPLQ